jgi:hypothetical protein
MDDFIFIFIFVLLTQYIGSCPIMDGVDVGNLVLYSMIIEAIPSLPQYKFCNEIYIFTCWGHDIYTMLGILDDPDLDAFNSLYN